MFNEKEYLRLKYQSRINLLTSRDEVGNMGIINKLKRKLRKLETA